MRPQILLLGRILALVLVLVLGLWLGQGQGAWAQESENASCQAGDLGCVTTTPRATPSAEPTAAAATPVCDGSWWRNWWNGCAAATPSPTPEVTSLTQQAITAPGRILFAGGGGIVKDDGSDNNNDCDGDSSNGEQDCNPTPTPTPTPTQSAAPTPTPQCKNENQVTISGAMEGEDQVQPGDTISVGYDLKIPNLDSQDQNNGNNQGQNQNGNQGGGNQNQVQPKASSDAVQRNILDSQPTPASVAVTSANVIVNIACPDGTTTPITVTIPDQTYVVSQGGHWYPTGDKNSWESYQGGLTLPNNLCGGKPGNFSGPATFTATVGSADTTDTIQFRFHYRDEGKGNWSAPVGVLASNGCPPTLTLVSAANSSGTAGSTLPAGTYQISNPGPDTVNISALAISSSDAGLLSALSVQATIGAVSQTASAGAGDTSLLNFSPALSLPAGTTVTFVMSGTLATNPSGTSSNETVSNVVATDASTGDQIQVSGTPLQVATLTLSTVIPTTASVSLVSSGNNSGIAGATVGAGSFNVINNGPDPITISSLSVNSSNVQLLSGLSLQATVNSTTQTASGSASSPSILTFSPALSVPAGVTASFTLSATISSNPPSGAASTEVIATVNAVDANNSQTITVIGLPLTTGTVGLITPSTATANLVTAASGRGLAGATVAAGSFQVVNNGPDPITINTIQMATTNSAIFGTLSLSATAGSSTQTVSSSPGSTTSFTLTPITLAQGAAASFALNAILASNPQTTGTSTQSVTAVGATDSNYDLTISVTGLPVNLGTVTLLTPTTASVALVSLGNNVGTVGQTVGSGSFSLTNNGPDPITVTTVTVTASNVALLSGMTLQATIGSSTSSASAGSSTPDVFTFSPPLSLGVNASASFALSGTVSNTPPNTTPTIQAVTAVGATDADFGGVVSVSGMPVTVGTITFDSPTKMTAASVTQGNINANAGQTVTIGVFTFTNNGPNAVNLSSLLLTTSNPGLMTNFSLQAVAGSTTQTLPAVPQASNTFNFSPAIALANGAAVTVTLTGTVVAGVSLSASSTVTVSAGTAIDTTYNLPASTLALPVTVGTVNFVTPTTGTVNIVSYDSVLAKGGSSVTAGSFQITNDGPDSVSLPSVKMTSSSSALFSAMTLSVTITYGQGLTKTYTATATPAATSTFTFSPALTLPATVSADCTLTVTVANGATAGSSTTQALSTVTATDITTSQAVNISGLPLSVSTVAVASSTTATAVLFSAANGNGTPGTQVGLGSFQVTNNGPDPITIGSMQVTSSTPAVLATLTLNANDGSGTQSVTATAAATATFTFSPALSLAANATANLMLRGVLTASAAATTSSTENLTVVSASDASVGGVVSVGGLPLALGTATVNVASANLTSLNATATTPGGSTSVGTFTICAQGTDPLSISSVTLTSSNSALLSTLILNGTSGTSSESATLTPSSSGVFTFSSPLVVAAGQCASFTLSTAIGSTVNPATSTGSIETVTAVGATDQTTGKSVTVGSLPLQVGGALACAAAGAPNFSVTGSMNLVRAGQGAAALKDGTVLEAAGASTDTDTTNSAEVYQPSTGTFSLATGYMNVARQLPSPSTAVLSNGNLLFSGGESSTDSGQSTIILDSVELYNSSTQTFTLTTGNMNTPRWFHTGNTTLSNGDVLIAGGTDSGFDTAYASAELYSPTSGTFSYTAGDMVTGRFQHTATVLNNGDVLLVGGYSAAGYNSGTPLASAELYNPTTQTFTTTAGSLNVARAQHSALLLNNGDVLIAGGFNASGGVEATAELYDPNLQTFTLLTSKMSAGRAIFTTNVLWNSQVLLAGGSDASGNPLSSSDIFDPATDTFSAGPTMNTGRYYHSSANLQVGNVLLAGGIAEDNASGSITGTPYQLYYTGAAETYVPSCQ